jgi:glutamate--cysteine ligase
MDLDPFCPVGIAEDTMRFLDIFLLHCVLSESPDDTPEEIATISRNQHRVAEGGRDAELRLVRGTSQVSPAQWSADILDDCAPIARALDAVQGSHTHRDALAAARDALRDSSLTPSARVLRELEEKHNRSYLAFAQTRSAEYRRRFLALPFSPDMEARYRRMAGESLAEQRRIEGEDTLPFEAFRQKYLSQDLLSGIRL